ATRRPTSRAPTSARSPCWRSSGRSHTIVVGTTTITGFHQDAEGSWIAELACGHAQHVRHRPPIETREWVTTEEGRRGRIGARLPCRYCRMPRLPSFVAEYKRTPVFDASTTPAGLRKSHT